MAKDYQRLWNDVTHAIDETESVRILAEILVDKKGRAFISRLERRDAELCIEILDHVSLDLYLESPSIASDDFSRKGIANHNLKTAAKQAFFVTLRRLAGYHGRLPDSMTITEEIDVEARILASGGFADIRRGTYMGHLVAVKTLRVPEYDNLTRARKVGVSHIFSTTCGAYSTWNVASTIPL